MKPDIKNKSICPLPWISASFNTDSSFRVCCNTSHGGLIKRNNQKVYLTDVEKYSEVQQAETLIELKQKMLADERPRFCNSCYDVESASGISIRQYYVKKYAAVIERVLSLNDVTHNEKIKFLDFSLTNNCNLKCRMCTPGASYLLSSDFDKLQMDYDKEYSNNAHKLWRYDGVIQNLISKEGEELTDILFTGGEPLTNQIHLKVLQSLISKGLAKNICLTYHSNLMVLPAAVLECWKSFKKVDLHLSLEGHEEYNDYIRYNSDWKQIVKNLDTLLGQKNQINLWLEIHTVFQAYNITFLPEYLAFLQRFDSLFPSFPHFIWIDNPSFLSVNSLTPEIKRQAVKDIEKFLEQNLAYYKNSYFHEFNLEKMQVLRGCLNRIDYNTNEDEKNRFKDFTLKFDKLRDQNILSVIPKLEEVFA